MFVIVWKCELNGDYMGLTKLGIYLNIYFGWS